MWPGSMSAHLRLTRLIPIALSFLILPLQSSRTSAQTVRGVVLDNSTSGTVEQAVVKLMGPDGSAVFAEVTTSRGTFVLRTVEPGNYRLRVELLGYATTTTELFELVAGEERHVTVRLGHEAIPLEPLTVHVSSTPEPSFLPDIVERARRGFGEFLLRSDLDRRANEDVEQLLGSMAGVRLSMTAFGDPLATMARSSSLRLTGRMFATPPATREEAYARAVECSPALYLNGSVYYRPRVIDADDPLSYEDVPIELIRSFFRWRGAEIEAIEVYPGPSSTPGEYGGAASRCGAIAIWTRPGGG